MFEKAAGGTTKAFTATRFRIDMPAGAAHLRAICGWHSTSVPPVQASLYFSAFANIDHPAPAMPRARLLLIIPAMLSFSITTTPWLLAYRDDSTWRRDGRRSRR